MTGSGSGTDSCKVKKHRCSAGSDGFGFIYPSTVHQLKDVDWQKLLKQIILKISNIYSLSTFRKIHDFKNVQLTKCGAMVFPSLRRNHLQQSLHSRSETFSRILRAKRKCPKSSNKPCIHVQILETSYGSTVIFLSYQQSETSICRSCGNYAGCYADVVL